MHSVFRLALLGMYVMLLIHYSFVLGNGYLMVASSSQLNLSVNPSAAVIKVGDKATINLTASSEQASGLVCFGEQGFPDSGFTLTFLPQCASIQKRMASAQLIVEATPAAAPQNFTALILVTLGNQTASSPLTITVVPAIPAWIPWFGILLFFLVIGAALFIQPRRPARPKGKGKMGA